MLDITPTAVVIWLPLPINFKVGIVDRWIVVGVGRSREGKLKNTVMLAAKKGIAIEQELLCH
jgi:hypothetical protein